MMKMTFELPPDIIQRLKIEAARDGVKLKDLVAGVLRAHLAKPGGVKKPKAGTGAFPLFKGGHAATTKQEITPERLHQVLYGSGEQ